MRAEVPTGLLEMLRVPGLGPRKIIAIREALGVTDLDCLSQAAQAGQLATLKGFGRKPQENMRGAGGGAPVYSFVFLRLC